MPIKQLIYNWFYTEDGEAFCGWEVGKHGVIRIEEHRAQGEGDRWYYDVFLDTGEKHRIFNPNEVIFEGGNNGETEDL